MKNKKEYRLQKLSCPNCASKIEEEVGQLSGITESSVNLINQKLSIVAEQGFANDISEKINKIVASHEPSVNVIELTEEEHSRHHLKSGESSFDKGLLLYLIRLIIAIGITAWVTLSQGSENVKMLSYGFALLFAGYEVLLAAGRNIRKGKVFDENFLMSIASIGAFLIGEQMEAVAVLVFYGVGELLQDMAVNRSRKNIAGLMDIRPEYANIILRQGIKKVLPENVKVGDLILIKPGERVPLDGVVAKGHSFIDARALTGESVPVEITEKDTVLSGTINTSGVIEVEVTKEYKEGTVSKILELVENSSSKKASSEKFITKFARVYTPIVVFIALGVALVPPLLGLGEFGTWIYRALSFLIISCPCALVISIPVSFFGGIGGSAKQGVLVKGGNYLDALNKIDTIVFDKTGTLTKGVFQVTKVCPMDQVTEEELLQYAAMAEKHSNHPIAKSIVAYYKDAIKSIASKSKESTSEASKAMERAGYGMVIECNEGTIYAGNQKLMNEQGISYTDIKTSATIVHIALNQSYLGYLLISDEVKPEAKKALQQLKRMGVRQTVMLTGDHQKKAAEVAEMIGIDHYQAELLPQEKVAWFERLKEATEGKGNIVFVGDGINDAPVLAGADIGIAMGAMGSDAAIEAADFVIMNDDLNKIVTVMKVAKKTRSIVTQNIVFALTTKILIMLMAFFGITSIWFAIFADVGVALIAIANAMRALRVK